MFVDYAYGAPVWSDSRRTQFGIYELSSTHYRVEDPNAVGGGSTDTTQSFRGKPPVPVAGQGWSGVVKSHTRQNNSSESGGNDHDDRLMVSYAFSAEKTAKLSGCSYKMIPVRLLSARTIAVPGVGCISRIWGLVWRLGRMASISA